MTTAMGFCFKVVRDPKTQQILYSEPHSYHLDNIFNILDDKIIDANFAKSEEQFQTIRNETIQLLQNIEVSQKVLEECMKVFDNPYDKNVLNEIRTENKDLSDYIKHRVLIIGD